MLKLLVHTWGASTLALNRALISYLIPTIVYLVTPAIEDSSIIWWSQQFKIAMSAHWSTKVFKIVISVI